MDPLLLAIDHPMDAVLPYLAEESALARCGELAVVTWAQRWQSSRLMGHQAAFRLPRKAHDEGVFRNLMALVERVGTTLQRNCGQNPVLRQPCRYQSCEVRRAASSVRQDHERASA